MMNRILALQVSFILVIVSVSSLTSSSALNSNWPIGDEWLYQFTDSYPDQNYSGYMRYICTNETFWTSRGISIAVVEFKSFMTGNISGNLTGTILSGTYFENSTEYYDLDTGATVAYITEQQVRIIQDDGFGRDYWNFSETNLTEYLPPGGLGYEPETIDVGTIWHKNFTKYSHSYGKTQGVAFDVFSNYTEHVKFTFLGYETVNVLAGSYSSYSLRGEYDDGTVAVDWYSDEVGNYVKIINSYPEGDIVELSLVKYTPYSENPAGDFAIPWWSYIFFVFIGATAVAAIAAETITRNKKF